MTQKIWTDEEKMSVAAMKRAGMSDKQIAARFDVSVGAVQYVARKMKARRRLDGHGGASHKPPMAPTIR